MWARVCIALNTTGGAYNIGSDHNELRLLAALNLSIAILFIIDLIKQP